MTRKKKLKSFWTFENWPPGLERLRAHVNQYKIFFSNPKVCIALFISQVALPKESFLYILSLLLSFWHVVVLCSVLLTVSTVCRSLESSF